MHYKPEISMPGSLPTAATILRASAEKATRYSLRGDAHGLTTSQELWLLSGSAYKFRSWNLTQLRTSAGEAASLSFSPCDSQSPSSPQAAARAYQISPMALNAIREQAFGRMQPVTKPLDGRTIIVTGANTGLGVSDMLSVPPMTPSANSSHRHSSKLPFISRASLRGAGSSSPAGTSPRVKRLVRHFWMPKVSKKERPRRGSWSKCGNWTSHPSLRCRRSSRALRRSWTVWTASSRTLDS